MSVTIAIVKSSCSLFADPAVLTMSAVAATSASTALIAVMRTFTFPP